MPGLQPGQAAGSVAVSVVIRNVSGASQWTCTVLVKRNGKREKCLHKGVSDTPENAAKEYDAHRKQVH